MLFGKNKKKENSFISEVDDSRVLVYDFRRRTNLLFENYRAVGYKKPENYHLEQLKSELTDTLTRLINANAVDAGNEDCLIDKILAPVRSGLIPLMTSHWITWIFIIDRMGICLHIARTSKEFSS